MSTDVTEFDAVDETWRQFGTREAYELSEKRKELANAVASRETAERAVQAIEAEVKRVSGPEAARWSDDYMRPVYEERLARARERVETATATEQEMREAVERLEAELRPPRKPTDAERVLQRAEADLHGLEQRAGQIDAEIAGCRDRIAALKEKASRETDTVKAAETALEAAHAEAALADLTAERDELPARIEWQRAWVAVKQAKVDGDTDAMTAALARLDAARAT